MRTFLMPAGLNALTHPPRALRNKKWQTGEINEKQLVAEIESRPPQRQEVQVKTCLLPRDYSSFGQNSKVTGKPC